jgi:hypothetical protein
MLHMVSALHYVVLGFVARVRAVLVADGLPVDYEIDKKLGGQGPVVGRDACELLLLAVTVVLKMLLHTWCSGVWYRSSAVHVADGVPVIFTCSWVGYLLLSAFNCVTQQMSNGCALLVSCRDQDAR